ncbi:hypothetical protein P8452_04103 [Trifolium repens]|nr:hypothetical protein P8452_04103 [Trifolium repens]
MFSMFSAGDFEEAVEEDAKTAVQDGTVHPLTNYVMNYVKFLYDYDATLKQLFQEFDPGDPESQSVRRSEAKDIGGG